MGNRQKRCSIPLTPTLAHHYLPSSKKPTIERHSPLPIPFYQTVTNFIQVRSKECILQGELFFMTRNTKHLHTYTRILIGIACSLLIIGSSTILLVLHNNSGSQGSTASTPHSTHTARTRTPTPAN